jgi:hypothetical protein
VASLKSQIEQLTAKLQEASQAADENLAKVAQDHENNEINREKNQIAMYQAETQRITALKPPDPAMTPEQVQLLVMDMLQNLGAPPPQAPMQQNMHEMPPEQMMPEEEMMMEEIPSDDISLQQMQEPTSPGMGDEPNFS